MASFEELRQESRWPPASNGMPDLGDDYPDTLLWQYIAASESLGGGFHSLAVNLARLSDKAVREYREASNSLTAFLETPGGVQSIKGHTLLLRATDHMENCIDAIRRVEGFFRTPEFQAVAAAGHREMLTELHAGVRNIRNSMQHAEARFAEGRIQEGEPVFPAMTSDCLYFAGEYILHAEITALVITIWQLAYAGVWAVSSQE